jgi:hypothetical protein
VTYVSGVAAVSQSYSGLKGFSEEAAVEMYDEPEGGSSKRQKLEEPI